MRVSLFTNYGALNSPPIFDAFAEGCDENIVWNDMDADVAVIWSILFAGRMAPNREVWDHYTKRNRPIIVIEVGALLRNETWRVGIGGINNGANFANKENLEEDRVEKFGIKLKPWKEEGQFITIATQRPDSHQWSSMPTVETYVQNAVNNIRKHCDKDIVIRPHPRDRITDFEKISKENKNVYFDVPKSIGESDKVNFSDILSRSYCVVNHSSNPALEATINGIHTFTGCQSFAYPMSIKHWGNLTNPPREDRELWLKQLTHIEWWPEEIAKGKPWNRLKNYLW
tara:strand:- start:923 stop:1777 length:855 start_codon:yes stop_codon:yes gene_type:complete